MHNTGYKSALARRACRYSDARPPRKTDGIPPESESPPHMRGKISRVRDDLARVGITPAYAGKRAESSSGSGTTRDHPRICGEKRLGTWLKCASLGSPPHMRGKAQAARKPHGKFWDHPRVCGEKLSFVGFEPHTVDHPRICGEKSRLPIAPLTAYGSPPHMRGKAGRSPWLLLPAGITPAYAGKRLPLSTSDQSRRDHPRVCEEK